MLVAIRISGMVDVNADVAETMDRLRLRRKYSAVLLPNTKENLNLLRHVRNHVAYGPIAKNTLAKLISARGQPMKKGEKVDGEKISAQLDKESLQDLGLKPFFRLHPPRGGIESKKHAGVGKGVLGDNKEKINELVERML